MADIITDGYGDDQRITLDGFGGDLAEVVDKFFCVTSLSVQSLYSQSMEAKSLYTQNITCRELYKQSIDVFGSN